MYCPCLDEEYFGCRCCLRYSRVRKLNVFEGIGTCGLIATPFYLLNAIPLFQRSTEHDFFGAVALVLVWLVGFLR